MKLFFKQLFCIHTNKLYSDYSDNDRFMIARCSKCEKATDKMPEPKSYPSHWYLLWKRENEEAKLLSPIK